MKGSKEISSRAPPPGVARKETDSSSRTDERFHLSGPSLTLDPRIHAYRTDIADIALAGQIFAPHYARPLIRTSLETSAVRLAASPDAGMADTLAPGDAFAVLEYAGGWAWGYVQATHLVGYVPAEALGEQA